jgi:hypothetical protein
MLLAGVATSSAAEVREQAVLLARRLRSKATFTSGLCACVEPLCGIVGQWILRGR